MELERFEIFSEFQINNFLTDIQITLINGTIKAHKLVLAASSEFFKALLNNEVCKEVSTGIINLPTLDYDVFSYIFDYIYMRTPELILNKKLSFYIDVIEASDYLRMIDIIRIIDSKISIQFSFFELCKEFDRIFPFPLSKTKMKVQTEFIDRINSRNYSDLSVLSGSTLVKIFETDNFTIDENLLWEFLSSYIDNFHQSLDQTDNSPQQLIDSIRPGLLNASNLECFYHFLVKHRRSWKSKTVAELRTDLSALPPENLRTMDFYSQSPSSNSLAKVRSVPYVIVSETAADNRLGLLRFSLANREIDSKLSIHIDCDGYRCHSFDSHLLFLNKDWDLNRSLGIVLNLANHRHELIPHWPHRFDSDVDVVGDDLHKFWGFSVALFEAQLFLFGGCYFTHQHRTVPSNGVARFSFVDRRWRLVQNVHLKVACWSSSCVRDRRSEGAAAFFISGGRSPRKYLRSFYLVDIDSGSVVDYPSLPFTMYGHSMAMVAPHVVAVHGGVWDGAVRHDVLLFELANSVWRVVSMAHVPGGVHIDYCCDTTGADGDSSDNNRRRTITFYELTKCDTNRSAVYLHSIDVDDSRAVSTTTDRAAQLVTHLPCAQPRHIMSVLSLKFAYPSLIIAEDVFN